MFYYQTGMVRRIRIHPQYLGGKNCPKSIVKQKAIQEIENSFTIEDGYCVVPVCITNIGEGYCVPLIGFVEFIISFEAILLFPHVGEMILAEVVAVTDSSVLFRHACIYGVVRTYALNEQDNFEYQEKNVVSAKGEVEKVGMLQSSGDAEKVIEKGSVIRLRITRRTLGGNGFFLVGSMFGPFLGPVKNPPPLSDFTLSPSVDDSTALSTLKIEDGIIPHRELQKVWKKCPYNSGAPTSPPLKPIPNDDDEYHPIDIDHTD